MSDLYSLPVELKYIVVRNHTDQETAIVFEKSLMHRDVASLHSASRGPWVVSAGFCTRTSTGEIKTYGESESLGRLQSRPQDAEIVGRMFQTHKEKAHDPGNYAGDPASYLG